MIQPLYTISESRNLKYSTFTTSLLSLLIASTPLAYAQSSIGPRVAPDRRLAPSTFLSKILNGVCGVPNLSSGYHTVKLKGGQYSGKGETVKLKKVAFGRVNGEPTAVALITTNSGGSMGLNSLNVYKLRNGRAENVGYHILNKAVQSIVIKDGAVQVTFRERLDPGQFKRIELAQRNSSQPVQSYSQPTSPSRARAPRSKYEILGDMVKNVLCYIPDGTGGFYSMLPSNGVFKNGDKEVHVDLPLAGSLNGQKHAIADLSYRNNGEEFHHGLALYKLENGKARMIGCYIIDQQMSPRAKTIRDNRIFLDMVEKKTNQINNISLKMADFDQIANKAIVKLN